MRSPLSALLLAALVAAPGIALAADDSTARAHQLLVDGDGFFSQGDYEKALARFNAAYEISGNPKILFDVAQCQLALLRPTEAATNFHQFLDLTAADPAMAKSDFRSRAQERLARLDAQLGRIFVSATPDSAQLLLDGKAITVPRQYVSAAPVSHTITAVATGFRPSTKTVSVPVGQLVDVTLVLVKEGAEAVATTVPAAEAPRPAANLTAPASTGPDRRPAYLVGGAAAAVAVGALALGLVTQSQYSALPINHSGHSTPAEDRVLTQARVTDVLWVAALATAGVATYLWFSAGPTAGGGGEAAVGGTF